MHGGEHQVAGEGALHRDVRGLGVADLADHDHVRVLAHERTQGGGKVQSDRRLHLGLVDALDFVLDRVLDRENLARGLVEDREHGRERRGLAAAGRPGDHDHAVRQREQPQELGLVGAGEAEPADLEQPAVARQ